MKPKTQLEMLQAELKRLRDQQEFLARQYSLAKYTPGEWEAKRRYHQLLSDIELTERRIYNLKRITS